MGAEVQAVCPLTVPPANKEPPSVVSPQAPRGRRRLAHKMTGVSAGEWSGVCTPGSAVRVAVSEGADSPSPRAGKIKGQDPCHLRNWGVRGLSGCSVARMLRC